MHGWFTKWVAAGLFEKAWQEMLLHYDGQIGIGWKWQSLDGVITKAPLGGDAIGPRPVDRVKSGTKRSILTDQRGAPISIAVVGANTHHKTVVAQTLDKIIVPRPEKITYRTHYLCLDKGYDYKVWILSYE